MKSICLFFLLTVIWTDAHNQVKENEIILPDLQDAGMMIENQILLDLPGMENTILRSSRGRKFKIRPRRIVINSDTLDAKEITTRGQTTLMFDRKSLNIKLKSKATFRHGTRTELLKDFSLLSLAMDKYYCRNRLAFEMLDTLGIFNLFYSFCELRINGSSAGVYMILERPEDWAIKEKQSPAVIRRGYDHKISKMKAGKNVSRTDTKKYTGCYRQIYRSLHDYEGKELYNVLQENVDMDVYMKWIAFNFLVQNGDYSDEIFFYMDPAINKYRIIPWDYDDIFARIPHEGASKGNAIIGDKLIFSAEDLLDEKIITDTYLYAVYLERLKAVLEILSPALMKSVFEQTYAELYPYYINEEIISNTQSDYYNDANLENLQIHLKKMYLLLCGTRTGALKYLAKPVKYHP